MNMKNILIEVFRGNPDESIYYWCSGIVCGLSGTGWEIAEEMIILMEQVHDE